MILNKEGFRKNSILPQLTVLEILSNKKYGVYLAYAGGDCGRTYAWTQENTAARLADGTDYTAKTTDNGRGGRIIRMKDTGNDLNNAVLLGHESYRDGIVDSGNADETINAVIAHTAMAANMESWGADVNLNGLLGLETAAYKSGNTEVLEAIAENGYDSSADYWLFKSDGRIVDDGTYYFSREIVNEKGEIVSEKITDFMFSGSRVAALVKAIGFDNVKKMLGEKSQIRFTNTDLYDEVTLKEVGLSEKEIWLPRKTGSLDSVNLSDDQKAKLLGEAYMQASGSSFNNETKLWEGGNTVIPGLEKNDSLGVIRDNNGKYQFFASGMTFTRQDDAFDAWKDGVDSKSYDVKDNTDVTIWKRDLFTGETISETLEGAWTSVSHHSNDNGTAINVDGHTYKQNTIISEYFKMHLIDYGNSDRYGVSTVGVITDATTLGGQTVDKYGKIANQTNDWGRWLIHSMAGNGGSAGCFGPMSDENVVIPTNYQGAIWNNASLSGSGASYMQKLINTLKNEWGIYNGYEFNMHLQGRVKP
jgi:hypothetical protein